MKISHNKIIVVALFVTIIHFILTSVIGHYIAVQIGTQMGHVVAQGLIDASESHQKAEAKSNEIYQGMKNRIEEITEHWKVPLLLISLPIKPLMEPLLRQIRKDRINMAVSKQISKGQFITQGLMIDYVVNFINSLSLGFLVYMMLRIFEQYKGKHNKGIQADAIELRR